MEMRQAAAQRCLHGRRVYEGKRANVRFRDSIQRYVFFLLLLLFMESKNNPRES